MSKSFPSLLVLLMGLTIAACGNKDDDPGTVFQNAPANPDKAKLLQLVNQARSSATSCGSVVPALTWNDTLAVVGKKHSEDMAANDKLNHNGSDGSFVDDRIEREGYIPAFYAENLLKGGATEEEAIQAWLDSPAHCANIMDAKVTEMGVGTSGAYWTLVLASH